MVGLKLGSAFTSDKDGDRECALLDSRRPQKEKSRPAGFLSLAALVVVSLVASFSRILHPAGKSSVAESFRSFTASSQAVEPFAAR